jgi:hypothetical protein
MKKLCWDPIAKPFLEPAVVGSICALMIKKYISYLQDETFELEVQKSDEWIQIRLTLKSLNGSDAYPVELLMPFEELKGTEGEEVRAAELVDMAVDYLDTYWNEYLTEERDTFLSLDWSTHKADGQTFFMRGSHHSVGLEKMADEFLAKHGTGGFDIAPLSLFVDFWF